MKKNIFFLLGLTMMLGIVSSCRHDKKQEDQQSEQQSSIEVQRELTHQERKAMRKNRNHQNLRQQNNKRIADYQARKAQRAQRNPRY